METPLMELPTTAMKHVPWRPHSENPDHKAVTEAVDAPKNPIGVPALIDPRETVDMTMEPEDFEPVPSREWNPDLHIVMRALRQVHQADRLIHATKEAAKLPGYRELVRYGIEFMYEGTSQTLNRACEPRTALPPALAKAEPRAPRQRRADRLQVVIELRDPATMRVEEHRLPVDVAFLNAPEIYWPAPDTIMLSAEGDDPTVTDLAELITDACFSESDHNDDDSVVTQLEQHRNHAYKTAANLLLPRNFALAVIVERHVKHTFESFLEDGERLDITAFRHHGETEANVNATFPHTGTDPAIASRPGE